MSEVPALPRVATPQAGAPALADQVAAVFAPGGALDRSMPDFEPRGGQAEMAAAVARVFDEGGVLIGVAVSADVAGDAGPQGESRHGRGGVAAQRAKYPR